MLHCIFGTFYGLMCMCIVSHIGLFCCMCFHCAIMFAIFRLFRPYFWNISRNNFWKHWGSFIKHKQNEFLCKLFVKPLNNFFINSSVHIFKMLLPTMRKWCLKHAKIYMSVILGNVITLYFDNTMYYINISRVCFLI